MKSVNPATGKTIAEYKEYSPAEVSEKLSISKNAFAAWSAEAFSHRAQKMKKVSRILRERSREYAELITSEMGKPVKQSAAEIDKCALACDFYADNAERFLAGEEVKTDASYSGVSYQPLGAVLAVMPWNFPFWQVFRFAAPTLMAGNVGVLKHASNVPGCAIAIEEIFSLADFPKGAFTTLLIGSDAVGQVIGDARIAAVTLTGSDAAGRSVAQSAGKHLKKCVLELGGSDPFIVLSDANIETASAGAVQGRTINSGQSCIAAKRFIVAEEIITEFTEAFVSKVRALKTGDPMDENTDVGPLVREDLLEDLHEQVQRSVAAGAELLIGGRRIPREGFFYEPAVLANVRPGMPAFDEETFGPVAAVIRADSDEHAIELANQSVYGLGASVWGTDIERARSVAEKVQAGSVFVNGIVKSDPRLPFGGIKDSGYGRELSKEGIREFMNVKTTWIK